MKPYFFLFYECGVWGFVFRFCFVLPNFNRKILVFIFPGYFMLKYKAAGLQKDPSV